MHSFCINPFFCNSSGIICSFERVDGTLMNCLLSPSRVLVQVFTSCKVLLFHFCIFAEEIRASISSLWICQKIYFTAAHICGQFVCLIFHLWILSSESWHILQLEKKYRSQHFYHMMECCVLTWRQKKPKSR